MKTAHVARDFRGIHFHEEVTTVRELLLDLGERLDRSGWRELLVERS